MDEDNRNLRCLFLISLICVIGINGQLSLDQLITTPVHQSQDPRYHPDVSSALSNSIFDLGRNIGTNYAKISSSKAQVFSPISIAGALLLLLLGANGQTFLELSSLFGFNRNSLLASNPYKIHEEFGLLIEDLINNNENSLRHRPLSPWRFMTKNEHKPRPSGTEPIVTHVANGVFLQNGFSIRPDYKMAVESIYRAKIQSFDFINDGRNARNYINEWVQLETNGRIKDIIAGPIDQQTKMILVSALYFKATWERGFFEGVTNFKSFYPDGENGPAVQVPMMANGGIFPYYDAKEYDCQILGIPYQKNISTMYIIIPNNSNRRRLTEMQAYLTADKVNDMILKMHLNSAVILFPKLHIENSINLPAILRQMGINSLFDIRQSDLSLLSSGLIENFSGITFGRLNPQSSFSRFGNEDNSTISLRVQPITRQKRAVKYKVESSFHRNSQPLRLKDFVINKKITKLNPGKKYHRNRRDIVDLSENIKNLDSLRNTASLTNPKLFASEILHKVDLTIDERGTEGGAATAVHLTRTGTDVVFRVEVPFLMLIQHDATKLPLFYGSIYEPTNF